MKRRNCDGKNPRLAFALNEIAMPTTTGSENETKEQLCTVLPVATLIKVISVCKELRFDLVCSAVMGCYPGQLNQGRFRGVEWLYQSALQQESDHTAGGFFALNISFDLSVFQQTLFKPGT